MLNKTQLFVFQVGQRTGKRGRPPKHAVASPAEVEAAVGAEPELAAASSVEMGDSPPAAEMTVPSTDAAEAQVQTSAQGGGAMEGEHTCSECGASFARRYLLIMHTLKHEKARGYKCSVGF